MVADFKCVDCGDTTERICGLDDEVGLCSQCGGLVLRTTDVFAAYFQEAERVKLEVCKGLEP